jgi:hypothetical protein
MVQPDKSQTTVGRIICLDKTGGQKDGNGCWSTLHNEELHGVYSSPNIIQVIKSGILSWAGHMARTGEKINSCTV